MDTNEMTRKAEEWAETAGEMSQQGQEYKRAAMERAREAGRQVDSYVHENVWMTVGAVAVVGALIGFLMGRRS